MARAAGMSAASVQRLWAANDIKPHLWRTFKLSNDQRFEEKFWDVIGLYLNPPDKALVLCDVRVIFSLREGSPRNLTRHTGAFRKFVIVVHWIREDLPIQLKQAVQLPREDGGCDWRRPARRRL
jgi:hypothetical protein